MGNDLNNSLSESMRSNKSNLGRTPIFSTNFHSPNSNSSENGSNLELERNIGSSMNHPHSGRIENVFIVGENRYRERNLAGDNGLELQHKGADSQNHRQLPPLSKILRDGNVFSNITMRRLKCDSLMIYRRFNQAR